MPALAILRQGDPTNARRSELAIELGKKGRRRPLCRLPRPRAVADRARGRGARGRNRASARSTPMPRRASWRRSRRACRSTRRRPCSRSAESSLRWRSRFLEALGARRLGACAMAEPFYITTAISYPNGRRISATPMKRSPPTPSPASSAPQGRDVRFVGGTDEHGLKMVQTARAEGSRNARVCRRNVRLFPRDGRAI